jgi:nitrate reductase gamma subunit
LNELLDFARGPLFRFTFALMVLGLGRVFVLDIIGAIEAYRRAGDRTVPWKQAAVKTLGWVFPMKRIATSRPLYSVMSILFHIGLIAVPILQFSHVRLWENVIGIGWFTLPKLWADMLTVTTILFGLALLVGRVSSRFSRAISRKQDYLWPLLLVIPFITGFVCANVTVSPKYYDLFMLMHVLSAELIFVLMPFTKIAHCVIMPLSQFITAIAWRFPADTDDAVCETLDKKGAPV